MPDKLSKKGYRPDRRLNWKSLGLVIALHLFGFAALIHIFAPNFTAAVSDGAQSLGTVIISVYEEPEPEASPSDIPNAEPDEGEAAEAGREAVAREVTAPKPPIIIAPSPAPRASSTGAANISGAREEGEGTGAGGQGEGTGSGRSGSGRGGIALTKPSWRSGAINSARDFPIPEGGRSIRHGTAIIVAFTVGIDGRASNCSIARGGPDARTNALLCPLLIEKITFNPARDSNGRPVPARYGWRQDFFRP